MKRLILKSNMKSTLIVYTAFVVFSLGFSPWEKTAMAVSDPNFPFTIEGSKFLLDGEEVFLNIIGYQPLEPGQHLWEPGKDFDYAIRGSRIGDDLRRWRAYCGGTDPVVVRVYPQPNSDDPNGMPEIFYDSVRKLGFWIIRDIYVGSNYWDPNAKADANDQIDRVIAEVNDANAFDRIFAWEIGNEFRIGDGNVLLLEDFICHMRNYIKEQVHAIGGNSVSDLVTWQSFVEDDALRTAGGSPVMPDCLDYISYNAYCYEPARIRDHQPGPTTGTPYQGYLTALKERHPNEPLVIIETGLSDSNLPEPDLNNEHERLHPWYPSYRKGALTGEQIAEGLAARYWDARLLRDANDTNIVIAGLAIFEWNDEWHKLGGPNKQSDYPEEHFGLGRFVRKPDQTGYQLRYKLQQETIRDLYTLNFDNDVNIIESLVVDDNSISVDANTWVRVVLSDSAAKPVRLRWECSRGYIIGNPNCVAGLNNISEPNNVIFYAGKTFLGPATVTAMAIDANSNVDTASISINIETSEPNRIKILTLGTDKASGRVYDVNLDEYKLVCYLRWDNVYDAQPYQDQYSHTGVGMKSIWINKEGYWWTKVWNSSKNDLYCWLVPEWWEPPDQATGSNWSPPYAIAEANTVNMDPNDYSDMDNDLLLDRWEREHFTNINKYDRYDDPDNDGAHNLEEFLAGTSPNDVMDPNKNDTDNDGLWDNWERHFFGDISFYNDSNDPDGDGFNNSKELNKGLNPLRVAADKDEDALPDLWEMRWFNNLAQDANDNPDEDCLTTNLDEYEFGGNPVFRSFVGDLDYDCDMDFYDIDIFQSAWLSSEGEENWDPNCDIFEPNDFINFLDYAVFAENWLVKLY